MNAKLYTLFVSLFVFACSDGDEITFPPTDPDTPADSPPCASLSQEAQCTTADGAPGWCVSKYWKPDAPFSNDALVCLACDDPYLSGGCSPGCTPSGDTCQAPDGSYGCEPGCCPICY